MILVIERRVQASSFFRTALSQETPFVAAGKLISDRGQKQDCFARFRVMRLTRQVNVESACVVAPDPTQTQAAAFSGYRLSHYVI